MKRALVIFTLTLSACGGVDLKDFPRPFACDHKGGDGGVQCAKGWSCGFDDRCFDNVLDGGQLVEEWRCGDAGHCPTDWQCSQEVDGIRNCQQIGVGAPTRCLNDDGGCEGGWRCGATHRCFDPTDLDGGTLRDCERDGECPDRFRCGQRVDREQKCIELGMGASSLCRNDKGCEGGWRCNTVAQLCIPVTDVVTTGHTSPAVGATQLNSRLQEDPPLFLAVSRPTTMPFAFGNTPLEERDGIMFARVFADGGLRVSAQFRDEKEDAGRRSLFEQTFAVPGNVGNVTDLALSFDGPTVRFRTGRTTRLLFDGGLEELGNSDFLRQADGLEVGPARTRLVRVNGSTVLIDGKDAGPPFAGAVREVVVVRDSIYALTSAGFYLDSPPPDGGVRPIPQVVAGMTFPILLAGPSRGAVAGFIDGPGAPALAIVSELVLDGGAVAIQSVAERGPSWEALQPYSACPDGTAPVQLAIDQDQNGNPTAFTRCSQANASYPVQVFLEQGRASYASVVEDQTPYQWGVVTQRSSPFVRAHAGSDGRVWHALDDTGRSLLGRAKLRPLILDRQPDTMLSFRDLGRGTVRVFAEAANFIFADDSEGGLVSQLGSGPLVPLSFISTHLNWIVAAQGLLDANGNKPRLIATMPSGAVLTAPVTGVQVQLQLSTGLRDVVLVASGDTIWVADVTDAQSGPFAQPAQFERVLVPVPGVRLRSMTLEPSTSGISGYLTTSTKNVRFGTSDLVRWTLDDVATPSELNSLPLEVWAEPDGGKGRTGFTDGRVWALPIMVALTSPLTDIDGGPLVASDFGRKCGDVFAATNLGVFRAEPSGVDGGLPGWVPLAQVNASLVSKDSLRLYETHDDVDRLFVGTKTGQVVELTSTCP